MQMNCEELLKLLNEQVDGALDPKISAEYRKHVEGCNPCQVVVDNIRKTIKIYKNGEPYELPDVFHARMHRVLREHWARKQQQQQQPPPPPAV